MSIEGKIGDQAKELWEKSPHLIPDPVEKLALVEDSYEDRIRYRR